MRRECGCRLAAELEESRRLAAEYESAAARAEQSSTEYREQLIQQQGSQTQPNSVELETELAQQRAKLEKAALEGQRLAADAAEKTSRCAELEAQIKTVGEVMAAMGSASEKIAKEHSAAARIARQWHRRHTNRVLRDVRKSCAAQLEQSRERERKLALAPSASSGALSAASGLQSPDGSPLNEPVYSRLLGDASLASAEGSKRASFSGNSSPSLDSPSSSASAEAAGGPGTSWLHGAGNSTPSAPSDTAAIVAQQSWSPTARTGAGSSHDVGGAKLTPQAIALAQQVAEAELKVALAERHNQQARLEHRRAQHEVARQRRFSPGGRRTPSTTQPTSSSKLDSKGRSSGMPNRHGSPASDRRRRHVSPVAFQDQSSDRKQAKQFLRRGGGSGGGRITESAGLVMPNKEERARIFRRMDYNGNGVLSLAEIDKAVVELWPQLNNKQVLMRAYQAADVNGDGLIGRREFRLLLQYVLYFHRLWDRFDAIDTDHDHRLTLSEFTNGCSLLGIPVADNEAANVFGEMDTDNGGVVRFTEFCVWCARHTVANEHRQQQGSTAAHSSTVQARAPGSPSVSMSPLGPGAVSLGQEPRQRGRYGEYRRVKKNDDATKAPVATSNALEHEKERPTGTAGMVKDNRGASRGSSTSQDEEAAQYAAAERLAAAATDPNISPSALVQAYLEATDTLADPKSSAMLYYKRLLPQNFQC
jgi:Ca2+-binding EF-hand superfamily protein